jgi:drug/metabolite transporter (DMT)-like permease
VLAGWVDAWPTLATYGLANPDAGTLNIPNLVVFSVVVAAMGVGAAAWSARHDYRGFGVVFGSISGFCGGISIFYQKAAMLHCACGDIFDDIGAALSNPFFYLFALTGVGDFLVTQVALSRAKAVTVVPAYQSWYMLVPVLGGVVSYYERFTLAQAAGVGLLGVGIVLVSTAVAEGVA